MTTMGRFAGRLAAAALWTIEGVAVAAALYLGAAAGGSIALPAFATPAGGRRVAIYVVSNGYHIDLVLPAFDTEKDWRPLLASPAFAEGASDAQWVAFGWGSRVAYTEVGALSDLSPVKMLRALSLDETVMHVLPVARVRPGPDVRIVHVAAPLYAALAERIARSFASGADGAPVPLMGVTQGYGDAYFEARGAFSPFRTCNVWAAEALRAGGAHVGFWTPFAGPVMQALPAVSSP